MFATFNPIGAVKFACSLGKYNGLRDTAALPGSSLEVVTFEHGTCQVGASNLSRSSLDLVKFKPGTFQVRAWDLRGSSLGPGDLEPGNRQVQGVRLPKSQPGSCQVQAANLSPGRRTPRQNQRAAVAALCAATGSSSRSN